MLPSEFANTAGHPYPAIERSSARRIVEPATAEEEKRRCLVRRIKCEKCDCTIHGEFMIICGEVMCTDCAADWMFDELMDIKYTNRTRYLQILSEALELRILEA